jgi:hypothetical protein
MAEAAAAGAAPLTDEVIELLTSGAIMSIATRDAALTPECVPAMGVRVHRDRRALTVYVPDAASGETLANLAHNGQIALTASRPVDEKSMQLKGRVLAMRAGDPTDRAGIEVYRGALAEQLAFVGLPRAITRRLTWWPSTAIDFAVDDVFVQTPGPGAGNRLGTCK